MHDARDRNAGVWIEASDRLYVAAYSSVASLAVRFSGYFRKANGEVSEYAVTLAPTSDRAVTEGNVFFGAGFLLSCVAHLASGNANRGQCYVRAHVQRGEGTPAVKLHHVIGGYVTDEYGPSFPMGKIEGSLEGPGIMRSITGTNPAAGVEISETVPTGARWKVHSVQATLVTSGAGANRGPALTYDDGTTIFAQVGDFYNQTAGLTSAWCWAIHFVPMVSLNTFLTNNMAYAGQLLAGYRIRTVTINVQAGDNWGAPQLSVEEWIEA